MDKSGSTYSDFMDAKTTDLVEKSKVSKWLPFIGKNYQKAAKKILIVGLSHYSLGGNSNWDKTLKSNLPNILSTFENGLGYDYTSKNFVNIKKAKLHRGLERIFFNVSQQDIYKPDFVNSRKKFWSAISFFQFIETPMQGGSKHQRSVEKEEMKNGQASDRLLDIIKIIKPDHVVMLSKSYKYHQKIAEKEIITEDVDKRIYENVVPNKSEIRTCFFSIKDGHNFSFSAIYHPSRYRHIQHQHALLQKTMPDFIDYLNKK